MLEESKFWVIFILAGLLGSLGYGAHYLSAVDEANLALQESKSKLVNVQEQLTFRKKEWSDREQALSKIQVETDKNATLVKAQDILETRYRKADGDLKYVVESMKSSVEKAREEAPGTQLAEIILTNGKTLRGVKIRKVEESGISMIHADGIGTIPLELLPENLQEKYDLGPKALIPLMQQAQTAFLKKLPDDDVASPPSPPSTPSITPKATPTPATKGVDDAKAKKIKLRIAELEALLVTYGNALKQYQDSAASYQAMAESARTRGQPTTRHVENANGSSAQAALVERQLASLREEREKLNVELEYATKEK